MLTRNKTSKYHKNAHVNCVVLRYSYQDTRKRSYSMVLAGTRWLGITLDLLSALLVGGVALLAALHSLLSSYECHFNSTSQENISDICKQAELLKHLNVCQFG